MTTFKIIGGQSLHGEVKISGAKNAVLPLIAATLLTEEPCTIKNVPEISDVPTMLEIIGTFGAEHRFESNGDLVITAANLHAATPDYDKISQIRASVLILGPLLGRLGEAKFAEPGGCKLGERSIDTHLHAFEALGTKIAFDGRHYDLHADKLVGTEIVLEEISLTGTENIIMAAVLASGTTTIHLAAAEPEILNLIDALTAMGAQIEGAGTHVLTIHGVAKLHGATLTTIPDRVEAATFAMAAAITKGELTIHDYPVHSLDIVTAKLRDAGVHIQILNDHEVRVSSDGNLKATSIRTDVYPGFPTDIQPLFAALMTQAEGIRLIHETMYDSRFKYAAGFTALGATVTELDPHRIEITGGQKLTGTEITCPDIRGGAGLLLAALAAEGETTLNRAELIERGYSETISRLSSLGVKIS